MDLRLIIGFLSLTFFITLLFVNLNEYANYNYQQSNEIQLNKQLDKIGTPECPNGWININQISRIKLMYNLWINKYIGFCIKIS